MEVGFSIRPRSQLGEDAQACRVSDNTSRKNIIQSRSFVTEDMNLLVHLILFDTSIFKCLVGCEH